MTQENEAKEIAYNEDRLLKIITIKLEEYGIPHFEDKFPAMDILQLVKDAGYRKSPSADLVPLDESKLLVYLLGITPRSVPLDREEIESLANRICSKFGHLTRSIPTVEDLLEIMIKINSSESCEKSIREGHAVYIALGDLREMAKAIHLLLEGK